ncbi:very short patch repair endonuclease [Candidatus Binatus sp.]|uniref:very short patch repair endonuclease n=1 Tax=Candidatus Binatus sp. TaxID=2811406 RepID=UPI003CC55434
MSERSLDSLSIAERSLRMSKVRSRGNASTEIALLRLLRGAKIPGWRRHLKITGIPDFGFPQLHVAIFVDGCFWHGCSRCRRNVPSKNRTFWSRKIASNRSRDRKARWQLRRSGWIVVRIWEHEFKNPERVVRRLRMVLARAGNQVSRDTPNANATSASVARKIS